MPGLPPETPFLLFAALGALTVLAILRVIAGEWARETAWQNLRAEALRLHIEHVKRLEARRRRRMEAAEEAAAQAAAQAAPEVLAMVPPATEQDASEPDLRRAA